MWAAAVNENVFYMCSFIRVSNITKLITRLYMSSHDFQDAQNGLIYANA